MDSHWHRTEEMWYLLLRASDPVFFVWMPHGSTGRALHQSLAPHCSAVLKGKRLLLFGEMLREISVRTHTWLKTFVLVLE